MTKDPHARLREAISRHHDMIERIREKAAELAAEKQAEAAAIEAAVTVSEDDSGAGQTPQGQAT